MHILLKSYSDVKESELIFCFIYVLCIIHLYKNLSQLGKRLPYSCLTSRAVLLQILFCGVLGVD